MNKTIRFSAALQQMAEADVFSMIPQDTLNRIKQYDAHPMFKVFSIGHEGEANGANVVGMGARLIRWARDVVIQMFNKINQGLKAFHGHVADSNSHGGRESIGELVGKTMQEIKGVLHTIGVVYIKPEYREKKFDVASLEGTVEFGESMNGDIDVLNVQSITGLAIGDGDYSRPAMPGATLQASLQMFTQNNKGEFKQMGEITKDQVKDAIVKLGLTAEDLYSDEIILNLNTVKKNKQQEYEWAKRIEKKLGEAREENAKLQGDITKYEGEVSTLRVKANIGTAREVLGGVITEKKLAPKFVKFVEKSLKDFKSDKKDNEFKEEFEKFVDKQAKEYKSTAELYGVKDVEITTEKTGNKENMKNKKTGAPAADSKGERNENDEENEYEDPKKNEFIPTDV